MIPVKWNYSAVAFLYRYIFLKDHTVFSAGRTKDITPDRVTSVYGIPVEIVFHNGYPIVVPEAGKKAA